MEPNLNLNSWQVLALQQIQLNLDRRNLPEIQELRNIFTIQRWWKEVGATIILLPRNTGKTTLCNYLVAINSNVELVNGLAFRNSSLTLRNRTNRHLIVDEYRCMNPNNLDYLLGINWETVLLIGSEV